MNDMNFNYTLGRLRSEVFRVLDEYSCNGKEHEIFAGGVGDMEKRFISAANSAIRLVSLACDRRIKRKEVVFRKPQELMKICDFVLSPGEEKLVSVPEGSGALSLSFAGEGKIVFLDAEENIVCEKALESGYGELLHFRSDIPEAVCDIIFICGNGTSLEINKLKAYTSESVGFCNDEKFLPDGKKLYCSFSSECTELVRAVRLVGERAHSVPCEIFDFSDGVLFCDEKYCGTYAIEYLSRPKELSESSVDEELVELSPSAFSAAVYAIAAELCEREDGELYSRLIYKYREILSNCYPTGRGMNRNSFYAGGLFGRKREKRRFFS